MKESGAGAKIIDDGGVIFGIGVDLILNILGFFLLAPNLLLKIAFVGMGIMIVLFIPRSWFKRQYPLYVLFVAIVFFFDYSFVLEATQAQSQSTNIMQDSELIRLTDRITDTNNKIDNWQVQYDEAENGDNMVRIDNNIKTENLKLDKYSAQYDARYALVEKGKTLKISSADILNAIPNAYIQKRYIAMIVFAGMFAGLQAIIASSITQKKKKKKRLPTANNKKDVAVKKEKVVLEKDEEDTTIVDDKSYRKIAKEEK